MSGDGSGYAAPVAKAKRAKVTTLKDAPPPPPGSATDLRFRLNALIAEAIELRKKEPFVDAENRSEKFASVMRWALGVFLYPDGDAEHERLSVAYDFVLHRAALRPVDRVAVRQAQALDLIAWHLARVRKLGEAAKLAGYLLKDLHDIDDRFPLESTRLVELLQLSTVDERTILIELAMAQPTGRRPFDWSTLDAAKKAVASARRRANETLSQK